LPTKRAKLYTEKFTQPQNPKSHKELKNRAEDNLGNDPISLSLFHPQTLISQLADGTVRQPARSKYPKRFVNKSSHDSKTIPLESMGSPPHCGIPGCQWRLLFA